MHIFEFKKINPTAIIPIRATSGAAGYDLFSMENVTLPPMSVVNKFYAECGQELVGTGIAIAISPSYYGKIEARSGLSVNSRIDVGAGVIDSDYRGEIKVLLRNFSSNTINLFRGTRIAQIVFVRIDTPELIEVSEFVEDSERGEKGFGSTDVMVDLGRDGC